MSQVKSTDSEEESTSESEARLQSKSSSSSFTRTTFLRKRFGKSWCFAFTPLTQRRMKNPFKAAFFNMGCLSLCFSQKFLVSAFHHGVGVSKRPVRNANRALPGAASDLTTRYYAKEATNEEVLDPLIVCGPSGVGKGTIIERFMSTDLGKGNFGFTTSHTTRQPREGEVDDIHYHFTSHDKMKTLIEMGKFLEHAEVHGNCE